MPMSFLSVRKKVNGLTMKELMNFQIFKTYIFKFLMHLLHSIKLSLTDSTASNMLNSQITNKICIGAQILEVFYSIS